MTIIENVKFKNSDYVLKFVTFYRHYVAMFNFFSFVHVINTLVFLLLFENRVHFNDTMLMVMESKYARIQCFFSVCISNRMILSHIIKQVGCCLLCMIFTNEISLYNFYKWCTWFNIFAEQVTFDGTLQSHHFHDCFSFLNHLHCCSNFGI